MSKARSRLISYADRALGSAYGFTVEVHFGRQVKHLPGRKGFVPGKSPITIGIVELQRLVEARAGTGLRRSPNRELVEFGTVIGMYVNRRGGTSVPTSRGMIHCSAKGAHVVPAPPEPPKGRRAT